MPTTRFRYVTVVSCYLALTISLLVLIGWQFDIRFLRSFTQSSPQTTPLTAILLGIYGISILYIYPGITQKKNIQTIPGYVLIFLPLILTIWLSVKYILNLDPGIETTLFPETVALSINSELAGRPSPHSLLTSLIMSSTLLFLLFSKKEKHRARFSYLGLLWWIVPWLALYGYVSRFPPFYSYDSEALIGMSPVTAITFLILTLAFLGMWPRQGIMGLLRAKRPGFRLTRILVIGSLIGPIFIVWLINYATMFGITYLQSISLSWGFFGMITALFIMFYGSIIHDKNVSQARIAELKELNTELEQFAFVSAHNLRAPITNIEALVNLLREINPNENTRTEIYNKLLASVDQLNNTIFSLNKVISVKKKLNTPSEIVEFEEVTQEVINLHSSEIEKTNALVRTDFDRAPVIFFPKMQLQQVLDIFLSNALKFRHPERKPVISIYTKPDKNLIKLVVTDNGRGLNLEEYRDKLFKLFERVHLDTEGQGTGLYLAKSIIDNYRGKIDVSSEEGSGTTFTIYLKTQ